MILPRRLFLTADGKFCEVDDIRQAKNFHPAGYPIPDQEAERIGLKAYLDETGWGPVAGKAEPPIEAKAVDQATTEDKALSGPEDAKADEPKGDETAADPGAGLHIDRSATRRRGPA